MRRLNLLALLTGSLFLSSCGDDQGFTNQPAPSAAIVVVNVIPDSPALSVVVNNSLLGQLQFGQSTDVTPVLPQVPLDVSIQFLDNETPATLTESMPAIEVDNTRILVLSGTMAGPQVVTINNIPADFQEGISTTLLKFVNVTSSVDSATVTLTNSAADIQTIVLTNGQPSESVAVEFGVGLRIETTDTATGNLLWTSGDFDLPLATERLIILADYFGPGGETVRMFSVNEQSNGGRFPNEQLDSAVRIANMTPDRGPLDISADGNSLVTDLAFGDVTGFLNVTPGTFDFSATLSSDATDVISTTEITILPGTFSTFGIAGLTSTADSNSFLNNDLRRVPTRASLTATQLAPSFGPINLFLLVAGQGTNDVFPAVSMINLFASFTLSSPSNTYDLVLTNAETGETLFGPQSVIIETNKIYSLLITDSEGGGEPLQVVFLDDFIE